MRANFLRCLKTTSTVYPLWLAATLFCASLSGQQSLSTLRGTVTDASNAVVAGVEIVAQETTTNVQARLVVSDNQGNYEMPSLKYGVYRLTAKHAGFKTVVADDVRLLSSQVRRVDFVLEVGGVETQVTVSERGAAIETEQGKISAEFSGTRYKDLPIAGNQYGGTGPILAIMPQVQPRAGGGVGSMSIGGQAYTGGADQVNMGMDGLKEETLNTQTSNMEAIAELRLVAASNSAEFSRVAYYDAVSKRGANEYHAELSYYHQNSALNARSFFEKRKTPFHYHTFNISASGPIFKDKTFFYSLFNGERVPGGSFNTRTVPTAAMRAGNFGELLSVSKPVVIKDPLTGQPFPGNTIPGSLLNATSLKLQEEYLPLPNLGAAGSLVNNFGWVHPYPSDQLRADTLVNRIDHTISAKNSFYGRLSTYLPRYISASNYPATTGASQRQSYSWAFVDTHVFTPTLVNAFTFGGNRDALDSGAKVNGYQPPKGSDVVRALGITGLSPAALSITGKGGGFPTMSITGYNPITVRYGGRTEGRSFTFADSLTHASARHIVKIGGEYRTYRNFIGTIPENTYGQFTFDGSLTGNAYADYMLGLPFSSTRLDPLLDRVQHSGEVGVFVTDTFKVNSRLNLEYGIRWDYFLSAIYEDGLQYNWDRKSGGIVVAEDVRNRVSPVYPANITVTTGRVVPKADRKNFAPRFGLAYRLSSRTVLRGGYGIFTEFMGRFVNANTGGPFQISETYFNSIQNGQALFKLPNAFPGSGVSATVPSQSASGYSLDTRNGYLQQYNLTVEHQIHDIGLRLSYLGSRGTGLSYLNSLNKPAPSLVPFAPSRRPYSQFVGVSYLESDGRSKYDAMTFEVKRRVGAVVFDAFWTWGNNMADFLNLEDPSSHQFWNHDEFTAKHRVVVNALWDVPVGRGRRFLSGAPKAVDYFMGGWRLGWVSILQTGQFFSPSFSGSDPSNTNSFGGMPDRLCDGNLPTNERRLDRWFDTSCFSAPPPGRYGNSGKNILTGPGVQAHSVSITKRVALTERLNLVVMSAMSNVFNHPNFYAPGSNISAPGQAGVITGQHGMYSSDRSGPRFVDMRVRLEF